MGIAKGYRMQSKSVLKRQVVKGRRPRFFLNTCRAIVLFCSYSLKLSFLLCALVLISLLFLFLYDYMLTSPYIKIEQVIVTGVGGEIKDHILKKAQSSVGKSLLAFEQHKLKQGIEENPYIKRVRIEKRFPHTLIIQAEKERPWAIVVMEGLHYMTREGKIFKKIGQTEDMDYPLITGLSKTGDDGEEQLKLAAKVLRVLEAEKKPWSLQELSEIHVKKYGGVSLYFCSLPAVIRLNGRELGTKMVELRRLVGHLKRRGYIHLVRRIDLNYRDGATVLFRKS